MLMVYENTKYCLSACLRRYHDNANVQWLHRYLTCSIDERKLQLATQIKRPSATWWRTENVGNGKEQEREQVEDLYCNA